MLRRNLIVLSLLFFVPSSVFAQKNQIQFSRIDLSNGLSHNQVNTILKDTKGFLWFGTLSGLNRFDGYQFKVFKHDPRDTTSIIDDFITEIYELPDNKLYLQTRSGPNIYDQLTQTFIRNVNGYLLRLGIKTKEVRDVLKDRDGNFWFNAAQDGVYKYDAVKKSTLHLPCTGSEPLALAKAGIATIQQDLRGNIWVLHRDRTIEMLNRHSGQLLKSIVALRQEDMPESPDLRFFIDDRTDLWIYTMGTQQRIDYYESGTGKMHSIDKGENGLNSNLVNGIIQDANGLIWIGTDHGGINLVDKKDFSVRFLTNKEDDLKSLGQNSIISLYKDPSGIIWAGTFKKGLSFYHEKILKFPLYSHQGTDPKGLTYDDVNRFAEDDKGNIWIGTNGGGLFYYNRQNGYFKRYQHQPGNPNSLSNDIIVSLLIDKQKKLWIGTYFGGLDSFDGQNFKHYRNNSKDPSSLADDRVWDLKEDRQGRFWIATLGGGLDLMDRNNGTFMHHKSNDKHSVGSNFISSLIEDKEGNIWIGTADGVDKLDLKNRFYHYSNKAGQSNTLINNVVYDVMQDSHGFIWLATRDGLSRLNPKTGLFRNFDGKDGLTEKATLKIVEDNNRNLWVSTSNGLFMVIVKQNNGRDFSYAFRKYDEQDGLQGSAFNANAGYKTRAGELLFGGANGFNMFLPQQIRNDNSIPVIVLSDLQISNKSINIGEKSGGRVALKKSLVFTDTLELNYSQNGFTIEFAALNFFNPNKIKYRYKLEGFDQHWQELQGDIRRASYTNIDPGEYTFTVVSTDASGNWVDNHKRLHVIILPPFYRTNLAYLSYILLISGFLLFTRHRGILRIKKQLLLEQERLQAKRIHDLDLLKIKFLTNVSHEFRTPLSLIITPLEKLIVQAKDSEKQQLQMIQRNGRRLLNLVNQLLDFRRMEVQELKLHPRIGDIILFIQELSLSFTDVAERKNICFSFTTDKKSLITFFDHDKIERIIFNLLSNAFKFTLPKGKVTVSLQTGITHQGKTELTLKVQDNGIGIDPSIKDRVFDRFFQSDIPDSLVNQGSGIGLSITKEFVKLHGGQIKIDSGLNEGCTFTVSLLLAAEEVKIGLGKETEVESEETAVHVSIKNPEYTDWIHYTAGKYANGEFVNGAAANNESSKNEPTNDKFVWNSKKPVLILVEDNEDFRFYLKDNLKEYYQIAEAINGKEGWQKILSLHPDLVVSDVSMPEMNGIDLCRKIKSDKRTAHLPVILLTALTTEDQQLTGLETGANDYMTKPFNFEILLSKIRNLLQQQALAKKTYQKQVEFKPAEKEIESVDDKFIRQLCFYIEQHLSDPAYTVDQLSADLNMSRVGLYKKILPLTGKSPIEYIRSYRLHKSKPLLLKSQMTIAEVAYEVGFSNPKHFSKYFKQEFDMLPSVYAAAKAL